MLLLQKRLELDPVVLVLIPKPYSTGNKDHVPICWSSIGSEQFILYIRCMCTISLNTSSSRGTICLLHDVAIKRMPVTKDTSSPSSTPNVVARYTAFSAFFFLRYSLWCDFVKVTLFFRCFAPSSATTSDNNFFLALAWVLYTNSTMWPSSCNWQHP